MRGVFILLSVLWCGVAGASVPGPCEEVGLDEVLATTKFSEESMSYYALHFTPKSAGETTQFLKTCLKDHDICLVQFEAGKLDYRALSLSEFQQALPPSDSRENLIVAIQYEDKPKKWSRCVVMLNKFSIEPSWDAALWDLDATAVSAYRGPLFWKKGAPSLYDLRLWIKAMEYFKPSSDMLLYKDAYDED